MIQILFQICTVNLRVQHLLCPWKHFCCDVSVKLMKPLHTVAIPQTELFICHSTWSNMLLPVQPHCCCTLMENSQVDFVTCGDDCVTHTHWRQGQGWVLMLTKLFLIFGLVSTISDNEQVLFIGEKLYLDFSFSRRWLVLCAIVTTVWH